MTGDDHIEALLVQALPMVTGVAHRFAATYQHLGPNLPDLVADGLYGAYLSAVRYDNQRGTQFTTYAYQNIVRYMTLGVRFHAGETTRGDGGGHVSLDGLRDVLAEGAEGNSADWDLPDETLPDPSDGPIHQQVRQAVRTLPPRLRHITYLAYWQAKGPAEIGRDLGMPPSTVSLNQKKALNNLRESLEGVRAA